MKRSPNWSAPLKLATFFLVGDHVLIQISLKWVITSLSCDIEADSNVIGVENTAYFKGKEFECCWAGIDLSKKANFTIAVFLKNTEIVMIAGFMFVLISFHEF